MQRNRNLTSWYRSGTGTRRFLHLALIILLVASPAIAQNPNYQLCFPAVSWFANGSTSPAIDGCIENCATADDPGWRGGFRYVFDNRTNGTPLPNVTVLGVRDASALYLGFEFHKSSAADANDVIMIALDPTGNAADRRLIDIFPYTTGGTTNNTGPNTAPFYFQDSGTFPTISPLSGGTQHALPAWLTPPYNNLRISATASGTDYFYSVELKIPLTGTDALPALNDGGTGRFGIYANVIRIAGNMAAEDSWPPPPDTALAQGLMIPPVSTSWGVGSTSGLCKGVSVASITANGGTTQLNLTTANNFAVGVQNNTVSSESFANQPAGTAVLAPQISPTLRIGIFGVPNLDQSEQIPMSGNPAPPQDIPANSTVTYNMGPWNLNATEQAKYSGANQHQCVMAILNSTPPSNNPSCGTEGQTPWCYHAYILNNAAVVNMNFGTVMSGKIWRGPIAQLATKGYTLFPNHQQTFVMQVRTTTVSPRLYNRDAQAGAASGQSLLWTLHAYRQVDNTITIHNKTYPIAVDAGSFGYQLQSADAKPDWRYQFFAENDSKLETLDANTYLMHVDQDKVGFVNATFEGDVAAGSGGPVGNGTGGYWQYWWILLLLLLLILVLWLLARRKHA
jgi:hypothetical protein